MLRDAGGLTCRRKSVISTILSVFVVLQENIFKISCRRNCFFLEMKCVRPLLLRYRAYGMRFVAWLPHRVSILVRVDSWKPDYVQWDLFR